MRLTLTESFKRRLHKKTENQVDAIVRCIKRLEENPRHPGLHSHRIQGTPRDWEAYVDDSNRVTFRYEAGGIVVLNHCNHDVVG